MSHNHYLGFKANGPLQQKLDGFFKAYDSGNKQAGKLYVEFIEELTSHVTNSLLVEMVEIAEVSNVGRKVVNMCVSSSNKVSSMLTAKIYQKRSVAELEPVVKLWKERLVNTEDDHSGDWYLVAPIDHEFGSALESIQEEKGEAEHFEPKEKTKVMSEYDRLSKTIIDSFFVEATRVVDIGLVTKKLLTTGVSTVEKAVESVFEKVISPLEPRHFGRFVSHTNQFHVRICYAQS